MHVMTSLNAINGVATSADPELVDGLLRNFSDSWNFTGFVVTDYGGWEGISGAAGAFGNHGCTNPNARQDVCCKDNKCAALKGVQAGLDSDGGGNLALQETPGLVASGALSSERIAMSFRRLMRQRVRLGMFDPPTANGYNFLAFETVESAAHVELARLAAQKAICLYQNRAPAALGDDDEEDDEEDEAGVATEVTSERAFWMASQNSNATLPLSLSRMLAKPGSVLLAGWTADDGDNLMGNYVEHTDRGGVNASILAGLAQALGAPMPSPPPPGGDDSATSPLVWEPGCSDSSCPETDVVRRVKAHAAAKVADVTILVLGLNHNSKNDDNSNGKGGNGKGGTHENEGSDRQTIAFPPGQLSLAAELSAKHTGTPLVCVLVHGGSLAPATLMRDCDAIVDLWYPGDMGGHALADVLFGRVSPAGRTTQTWYTSDETMPKQGLMTMRPDGDSPGWTYRYYNKKPAIPFGFGLSFTEFKYSGLTLDAATPADPCAPIGVNVTVANVGKMDSDEVVQCYIKQPNASTGIYTSNPPGACDFCSFSLTDCL